MVGTSRRIGNRRLTQFASDPLVGGNTVVRIKLGGPAAHNLRCLCIRADHRNRPICVQRQQTVVFQQNRALGTGAPNEGAVFRAIVCMFLKRARVIERASALHQPQDVQGAGTDHIAGYFAVLDRLDQFVAAITGRARHFQIQTCVHRFGGGMRPEPVRHDDPVIAPLIP